MTKRVEKVSGKALMGLKQEGVGFVSDATRKHEATVAVEHTWPALPKHLRCMIDWRLGVRGEVACGRG